MSKAVVRSILLVFAFAGTTSCRADSKIAPPDAALELPACNAQNLWWGTAGEEGAAGHGILVVGVVNTGTQRCTVEGYPSVDAEGEGPFDVKETPRGFMLDGALAS